MPDLLRSRSRYRHKVYQVSNVPFPVFPELALARADGSYLRLLAKFARVEVFVLD